MGLLCEFDVITDFGFLAETEEYGIVPDYSQGCEIFVEAFLKYSQQLVPVDTGYLRSTLDAGNNDTSCYAETNCEYAQYVEYGTAYMADQPYFTPALEMALLEAEPAWREAEEQALMEEEILIAEEEMMEQAEALAREQSRENGAMQAMANSKGMGPQNFGGLNFSSPASLIGSILGMFIAAVIITTVQAMMGKDFSNITSRARASGGGAGGVYVPEVLIT